ncbi:hypothetical protein [uncultured Shimia sp.]|uniref:hypothetical protein n=1 Tax=uncultured Shimia sp. TaxID=573152 RepID=UPI002635A823|nr:hypothetical protein [uncultured Shimia sp.]
MDFSALQKRIAKFKKPVCRCMYVSQDGVGCKNPPIKSHSLQKSGALKEIAENGHVMSIQPKFTPKKVDWDFRKIGHSQASTFPGYCKKHDSELFADVEDDYKSFGDRTVALLTLRSISREYFTKLAQIRMWTEDAVQKGFKRRLGDSGYEELIGNAKAAGAELAKAKAVVDTALNENDFSMIKHVSALHAEPLPFAFTGAFNPEFTVTEEPILPDADKEWGSVFAFCGNLGGSNFVLLSTVTTIGHGECAKFLNSITDEHSQNPNFWLNLGLKYIENSFFRPSWVAEQRAVKKLLMIQKFRVENSLNGHRAPTCLNDLAIFD